MFRLDNENKKGKKRYQITGVQGAISKGHERVSTARLYLSD